MNFAFIPARSGSKRLKDKNFKTINNESLLEITISLAKKTKAFDEIYVSSDDLRAQQFSKNLDVNFILRSKKLSEDKTKVWDVLYEFLISKKDNFQSQDKIVLLLPTSPNRTKMNIEEGLTLIDEKKSNVLSVSTYKAPIEFALKVNNDSSVDIKQNKFLSSNSTQTQQFSKLYYPNGNFFGSTVELYLKNKSFYANPLNVFITKDIESIDINTEEDLELVRNLKQ